MNQQATISERLSAEQSDVRAAALADLLQSGADVSPHIQKVAACISDPSESLRLPALLLLSRLGAAAAEYLPAALDAQQPDTVRAVAAALIAGIGPPAAASVRGLCRCLTSADEGLRNAGAIALAKIGESAVASLRIMLQFPNPDTVTAAVESLAMIGRPAEAAVPELEALAAKSPLHLQLACAKALSCLTGDPGRGLPILSKALEYPDPLIRKTAAEKIAGLGEAAHPAIPNLLRCIVDPDEMVRVEALLALGRIRAPHSQTVSDIALRLNDPAAEVRYAAAVVLASYGANARSALTPLRTCLQDPVEKVAQCAAGAIKKIEELR
jgi:HEAT repeat protein